MRRKSGGWFVDAVVAYAQVLDPDVSLLGPNDPPHAYFARQAAAGLSVIGLSEIIADIAYGTDYAAEFWAEDLKTNLLWQCDQHTE